MINAWISPNGMVYYCDYAKHDETAKKLLKGKRLPSGVTATEYLHSKKWIRLVHWPILPDPKVTPLSFRYSHKHRKGISEAFLGKGMAIPDSILALIGE